MPRLSEAALKRLEEVRTRSDELEKELADPATFEDARAAAELSREHSELADIVAKYTRYVSLAGRLDEAESLLRDGADEEMRALAEEEIATVGPELDEVVDSMQEFLRPRDPNDTRDVIL